MGYYICVNVQPDLYDKVLSFLEEHFRPSPEIFPWVTGNLTPMEPPRPGKLVCAYAKDGELGFYYGASWEPEERLYAYGLIRWLALHAGRVARFNLEQGIPLEIHAPYYCREGERVAVVNANEHPSCPSGWNNPWDLVDKNGFTPSHGWAPEELEHALEQRTYMSDILRRNVQADRAIKVELSRLSQEWTSEGRLSGTLLA